jgi:oxygen-independent coproporphyrinogen III oxidase
MMSDCPDVSTSVSLYIHIPFCATKCTYCAFNTYTNQEDLFSEFVEALIREICIVSQNSPYDSVRTVFLGGGTPTLLSPAQLEHILNAVRSEIGLVSDAEISIEANPNDLTYDYLYQLRTIGFNRLSIGMQSANLNELQLYARRHDNSAVVTAFTAARDAGFANINLDLIYGAPHQTLDDWAFSLQQALTLDPEHIAMYALTLEEGTPMQAWVNRGRLPMPDDDNVAAMYEFADDLLAASGYEQYEISNWSKQSYACHHNLQYWHNLPYIGLGPGAHGYAAGVRYSTILRPQHYIDALAKTTGYLQFPHTPAVIDSRVVTKEDEISETLMMGLRLTTQGIERHTFQRRFDVDLMELHGTTLEHFACLGLLEISEHAVRISETGRLLINVILRELI